MNQTYTPKFQEEYSAKIPALTLLTSLGWTFLSPKQIMDYRCVRFCVKSCRSVPLWRVAKPASYRKKHWIT